MLLINASEDDTVCQTETFNQLVLEDFAAKGVGARLEDGPETRLRIDGAQGTQGFADGRGVVGEVVNDGDTKISARTSRRRLTLLKLARAATMASLATP